MTKDYVTILEETPKYAVVEFLYGEYITKKEPAQFYSHVMYQKSRR